MSISDIKSRQPVLDAIAEFDRLGSSRFLEKYRFSHSLSYWLIHNGRKYDSKAIIGAAHGYAQPGLGPLRASDFKGGKPVKRKLEQLGFKIELVDATESVSNLTSNSLMLGEIYTRNDLSRLFNITDATLNTGVFHPKGTSSVWLFITEQKTADRTPYRDQLQGPFLYWQGQKAGRTDELIIDHQIRGLELLVFFRKKIYEHLKAGFQYLGPFVYLSHTGHKPTNFLLQRKGASAVLPQAADEEIFDPTNAEDARKRILRSITQRRGQKTFRDALRTAYNDRCAITGCSILHVLEAAHIYPYRGPDTNKVTNGLLLRADVHTLFDCHLLTIDSATMTVLVAPHLRDSEYGEFHGRRLRVPERPAQQPSTEALDEQRKASGL